MVAGVIAPAVIVAATPLSAGAAAVFYCFGPVPEAATVAGNTVNLLDTVGAPVNVGFSSIPTALAAVPGIDEPLCVQQIPLPTP